MSSRRKISVELPKRPSVFERLGTKPGMPQPKLKQSSRPKTIKPGKEKHTEKEPPPPEDRLLPKKTSVTKETDKIPKDLKKKRVKRARSRSSSSSSSSSGSSSSSSSSSDSSSSSEDEQRRKRSRKRRRSPEFRRRAGASRDKSRSPQRKRRDKKRLPPAKKLAAKKVASSPARSKASSVPAKKRRSASGKGKGQPVAVRPSVRRSTSRGRKRSRSRDAKRSSVQRHHSVSPKVRSRSPRRGSPIGGGGGGGVGGGQGRKRSPSPRRRTSRSPGRGSATGAARRDGSRRRSVERPRPTRSPGRQPVGYDRRAASTSRERVGGDRKDRRSLPRSSKQMDGPVRAAPVDRVWEEPARLKEEVRRRRDDPRDRQWPARPPSDYGREPLPYEEVPLLPPRRFSPVPVRGDGRRPPLLAPPCGDDRMQRPPPYGRHGPDERRSMDRMLPPRADEWIGYDDGPPPIPPPPPPPPPAVGRGMARGGRDWSSPGRGPNFRRGVEPWGGPMPRINRGGFRRGGGGGGGFHGGGGGGAPYYDQEAEMEPPPDPGDMIVRDEVRSEEGGSGAEDERASPAADRRSDTVTEAPPASRDREPAPAAEVWSGGKEPWTPKAAPTAEPEVADPAAAAAAPAATSAVPTPAPDLNIQAESLSDFSDDADEILNREDEVVEEEITFEEDSGQDGERACTPCSGSGRLTSGEQSALPNLSSTEQTEQQPDQLSPAKPHSLVDALAIDWSSLVTPRPQRPASPAAGTALQRFSPAAVFAQIGVCSEWAGPRLMQRVTQVCSGATGSDVTPPEPVPTVEELQRRYLEKGRQLLSDPGPHRRALCTKADLAIRRHLCEVTEVEPLTEAAAAAGFKRDTFSKHLAMLTATVS